MNVDYDRLLFVHPAEGQSGFLGYIVCYEYNVYIEYSKIKCAQKKFDRAASSRSEECPLPRAGLAEIGRRYGLRIWVEQSYGQVKGTLGWSEYQVSGDIAIRQHWAFFWRSRSAEGSSPSWQSTRAVARHGLLKPRKPDTVYAWIHRYRAKGLPGLLVRPGRGRKAAYLPRQADRELARSVLLDVVRRDPASMGHPQSRWTRRFEGVAHG